MMHILVLAVLSAAGGAAAFEPNTGSSLLVQAGACSAFEFTPQPAHKFSYTLKLLSVGAAGCDRGLVRWVAPRAPICSRRWPRGAWCCRAASCVQCCDPAAKPTRTKLAAGRRAAGCPSSTSRRRA